MTDARVHDLGYKRYLGSRRPQATRYRVIIRNVVATSWRGWWRMKLWVIAAVVITAVFAATSVARVLPVSRMLPWGLFALTYVGVFLSLTVVATLVAADLRSGAFEVYFSRSVRPIDYAIGKIGGAFAVVAIGVASGQVVLALFEVGMSASDLSAVTDALPAIPQALAVGAISAFAYTATPMIFVLVSSRPRNVLAAWAVFYIVAGEVFVIVAHVTELHPLAAFDVKASVLRIGYAIYGDSTGINPSGGPPVWAAATALIGYAAVGVSAVYWRVARAQRRGIGGG